MTVYVQGILRRYFGVCPHGCGYFARAWTRRGAVLERDRHAAVCRFRP